MTTKPLVGSQPQRQSQRPLNTNTISRPSPHRSLASTSPTRRHNECLIDLTLDVPDATSARYGQAARTGGSRLKQEILDESKSSVPREALSSLNITSSRPSLPPRGRPQLHADVVRTRTSSLGMMTDQYHNHISAKPMPLPVRPGQHAPSSAEKTTSTPTYTGKKDVRPKPYVLEVPVLAPTYPPNGHADFFPWTGNHPEDQFSEPVIRQGFFDKAQMTQNETGSAKASIYSSLKHKSGLQTLSSLFTSVLTQRRAHGNITANSTFKPPPRVTVTDTKREIWLKDLANPTISLRRLSRSIPHGIRGRVLLEHSLSKNIPIERAVWLAKCVGANELRSFRRKGAGGAFAMGGEGKWVRDFTVCVEQVLEGIVGSCGDKDFRRRIYYAIRLAAHFHAESLLDREHYMDWILSSLETTSQSKLPIWLLVVQVYWKDILKYRRFGRRLAADLLLRFSEAVQHPDVDILGPLIDRLSLLLKDLMLSNPDNFVCPEIWSKHKEFLRLNLTHPDDDILLTAWAEIDRRNVRLSSLTPTAKRPPERRLVQLLDKSLFTFLTNEVIDICWQLDSNKSALIYAVLDWSTSCYRPGKAKVFIGARILRSWSKFGADATGAILAFLDSSVCEVGRNKSAFYHLVSELARSNTFCISTYFQWLIGRGGIHSPSDLASNGPCATRLLAEIPVHDLSGGMIGLRRTLLDRAGYSLDTEEEKLTACIATITGFLPGMPPTLEQALLQTPRDFEAPKHLSALNRSGKSEIGFWLRRKVALQIIQPAIPALDDWDVSPIVHGTPALTATDFGTVREYLEITDDFSMLADVMKVATGSNDPQVLTSCADTLNLHIHIFAAIGALKGLFDILVGRLRSLADDLDTIPRNMLASLSDLSSRIPENHIISAQLARQLSLSDRKCAADACSPVSDHMAGVLNNETEFIDEIEKVLANGTSMDQGTMERLFQKVTFHLSTSWEKSPEQQRRCVLLLTTLRDFNPQPFDLLMTSWLSNIQRLEHRPSMVKICGPLIGLGCLSIKNLVDACLKSAETEPRSIQEVVAPVAMELLALLLTPLTLPGILTPEEAYRIRLLQAHTQLDHPMLTLMVIRSAFEACSRLVGDDLPLLATTTLDLLQGASMHNLLQTLVLVGVEMTSKTLVFPLAHGTNEKASGLINAVVNRLLLPGSQTEVLDLSLGVALKSANDLNLPFCQLKVASAFGSGDSSKEIPQMVLSTQIDDLNRAIESVMMTGDTAWACIIPSLDISVVQHLRRAAESRLLALFHAIKASNFNNLLQEHHELARAENLLTILGLTIDNMSREGVNPPYNSHSCFPELISLLNSAWQYVANAHNTSSKTTFMTKWLPLLLSFTASQTTALEHSRSGHEHRGRTLLVLTAIFLDLHVLRVNTEIQSLPWDQCFDLILYLVDALPDDIRQQCARNVREVVLSPVVSYVYSIMAIPSDWLYIGQVDKIGALGKNNANVGVEYTHEASHQLTPFVMKRWEMLGEPTPNMGENDTSLSLTLFASRKGIT